MNHPTIMFIVSLQSTFLTVFWHIVVLNLNPLRFYMPSDFILFIYSHPLKKLRSQVNLYFNSCTTRSGLVLIAMSTVSGFPTALAIEKIASLAKKLGGRSGKEIQATPIVVSMSDSNHGSHLRVLICQ
uniref:Putative ovule protein n=1 Tax=Solanum chacoense TaxID=4108 RepID=A0A0V0HFL5_SOLCH